MTALSSAGEPSQREGLMPQKKLDGIGRRARGLGWFSIGLGLTELLAPAALARAIGAPRGPRDRLVIRALGARELLSGFGLLSSRKAGPWLWSRVVGDIMDLTVLARAYKAPVYRGRDSDRLTVALTAVVGTTAMDVLTGLQASRVERQGARPVLGGPVHIETSITVGKPIEEVYAFWRNLNNLPTFMSNVQAVQVLDTTRSRWTVKIGGKTLDFDATITADRPNQGLAWHTLEGADVVHRGEVRFVRAPDGQRTEIHVAVDVNPPGGRLGRSAATLGRMLPKEQITNDLRRLKQGLEVGEVIRSDASIHDGPHPARPSQKSARQGGNGANGRKGGVR